MSIDIAAIKTNFKTILDTANTTTAAHDLSSGMSQRVKRVLKVNPSLISPQASFYPWVTISADRKAVEHTTIAKDQLVGKRAGEISFNVVGAVWEQICTSVDQDPADENVEKLMENIEEIIRRNYKLGNTVNWTRTQDVAYHSLPRSEQTHLRVGVLTLVCRVDY